MSGDEPLGIGFVRRDRFFDHDMNALFQSGNTQRGVLKMRSSDNHGIHSSRANEFLARGKRFQAFEFIQLRDDSIRNRYKLGAIDLTDG